MTATAKSPKLSQTMEEALVYLGRGFYRAHMEPEKRTILALERRGMIEWDGDSDGRHDTTRLWNVTVAGWAFLKDAYQIERPADEGRLTMEEALADALWIDGRTGVSAIELDAILDARTLYPGAPEEAAADEGRLTVEEALAVGYPETWEDAQELGTTAVKARTDHRNQVRLATTLAVRGMDATLDQAEADAKGRLTVEEALELTYSETPTAAERAEDLATGLNGLAYPSFGEAAGAAMEHNARMAARIVESRAAEAALDQAEADAKDRLAAVVKQQAHDDRPKTAMTELAAEDFQPGYRYWAVRPGFEAAWTIASVEIKTAEYSVWRDGKEITPELVVITRGDGDVRTLEKGEMVAIMGPWKTCTTCRGRKTVLAGGQPAPCWECQPDA